MKHIRKYNINESKDGNILIQFSEFLERYDFKDSSNSGNTSFITTIYDDPHSAKSTGAGFLLRKDLEELEFQDMLSNINAPKWFIKELIKNPNGPKYKRILKFQITLNNLQFLKDKLKERGELYCEYCPKGPLVIYDINPKDVSVENIMDPNYRFNQKFNPKDGATCDHRIPLSKGGDKFDYKNLAVCCYQCNQRKKNVDYDTWLQRVKKN